MKDIFLSFRGFENNLIFKLDDQNGHDAPWKLLKKGLTDSGYNFQTVDQNNLSNAAGVIFINDQGLVSSVSPERDIYGDCVCAGLQDKIALILWEGPSVRPGNYSKELLGKFPLIFTWRDELVDNKKFFKFYLPCPVKHTNLQEISFADKKFLVNISINKRSALRDELYSVREKSIAFFDKKLPGQFDLYGYRWNSPITRMQKIFPFLWRKYKSYKGVVDNKLETLSHYKFSLCYENCRGLNGYVTEKIFDCFLAKNVPIYWGAENIIDYVDKEAFIDRRDFPTDQKLLDFLTSIDEVKYKQYIEAGQKFLQSEKYKLFLPDNFVTTVIDRLKLTHE